MPTLGDRIREVREERGWTLEKLAEKTGLSRSFLSEVENNKATPSAESVLKISNALGVSLDYLLKGEIGKEERERKPVEIPPTLSAVAAEEHWSFNETMRVLAAHNSVVGNRGNTFKRQPSKEEWKQLHEAIKKVYNK
ncbi:MAG: hypothetical protein DMG65_10010 [Candidatus Angelobacter sp. Gp1-AA117]|nr:MAG: hypothetical protein DMG65_10010 [Candidatus Angelobacter sp. Gp1-AA117]